MTQFAHRGLTKGELGPYKMQHNRPTTLSSLAVTAVPGLQAPEIRTPDADGLLLPSGNLRPLNDHLLSPIRASVLSFQNMHLHGDLLVKFMKARRSTFIDRLKWQLPVADEMEYDQYDTPACRWIVVHEFGEVVGGVRVTPTMSRCGIYSYMLRDAQRGLLSEIPTDVLYFEVPVSATICEASRLFLSPAVPGTKRSAVQKVLMRGLSAAALSLGAKQVIGIVPAVWSRWLRRLDLDAVAAGPSFAADGTVSQAALFNAHLHRD